MLKHQKDHIRTREVIDLPDEASRQRRLECTNCGYKVRTSAKWIKQGFPTCPCGTKMTLSKWLEHDRKLEPKSETSTIGDGQLPVDNEAVTEIKKDCKLLSMLMIRYQAYLEAGHKPDSETVIAIRSRIETLQEKLGCV